MVEMEGERESGRNRARRDGEKEIGGGRGYRGREIR